MYTTHIYEHTIPKHRDTSGEHGKIKRIIRRRRRRRSCRLRERRPSRSWLRSSFTLAPTSLSHQQSLSRSDSLTPLNLFLFLTLSSRWWYSLSECVLTWYFFFATSNWRSKGGGSLEKGKKTTVLWTLLMRSNHCFTISWLLETMIRRMGWFWKVFIELRGRRG